MTGLAKIPLVLSLAFMFIATATIIKFNQTSQNLQKQATEEKVCLRFDETDCFTTPCCEGLTCQQGTCTKTCPEIERLTTRFCSNSTSSEIDCPTVIDHYRRFCEPAH